jgi:hypothetical protein
MVVKSSFFEKVAESKKKPPFSHGVNDWRAKCRDERGSGRAGKE